MAKKKIKEFTVGEVVGILAANNLKLVVVPRQNELNINELNIDFELDVVEPEIKENVES